jgi:urea transport system permease protein
VFVTWLIVGSKYGKLLIAVRDAESRTRFLGWRAENVKLFAFTVSAVMAGVAGALYVPQVGIINPGEFDPGNSIEVVIWTAVGGRGTIVGPIIGALLVNSGKSYFTGALPDFWLFALGGLFIAVTLLLPKGIVGLWDDWQAGRKVRGVGAPPAGSSEPKIIPPTAPGSARWSKPGACGAPEPQPAE